MTSASKYGVQEKKEEEKEKENEIETEKKASHDMC